MNNILSWFQQLDISYILKLLITAAAAIFCITFHEFSHGYAACKLGDPTAKLAGRLTLNPLKHLNPVGFLCMIFFHFGWAKPVPFNPANFKNLRRDVAITALAGPVSNVLLSAVFLTLYYAFAWCFIHFQWGPWAEYVLLFFDYGAILSAGLAVFNLFPVPPLDGSKVLFSFLPAGWYKWVLRYERYGFPIMIALIYFNIIDAPLLFLRNGLLDILIGVCRWPVFLLELLFG